MKSIIDEALARHETEQAPPAGSPDDDELRKLVETLKISVKIVGCGGGGSNTINRLTAIGVSGAQMCAINTDATHLLHTKAAKKLLIGRRATKGLGAGALPEVGEGAARENEEELRAYLEGAHVVFVTAGMGGGTGTGAAPVVANIAKEQGALVMGIVTMPFKAEGHMRYDNAMKGLNKLKQFCDTTTVIQNDKLLELVPRLSVTAAFKVADEVLMRSIKGITEVVTKPGLVNLDFNDLKTIMRGGGVAMIGLGEAEDEDRAAEAVNEAINSPLIDVDISDAAGALVNVTGGPDMSIAEAEEVAEIVQSRISGNARIIWGAAVDPELEGKIRVMVVITGVKSNQMFSREEGAKTSKVGLDLIN